MDHIALLTKILETVRDSNADTFTLSQMPGSTHIHMSGKYFPQDKADQIEKLTKKIDLRDLHKAACSLAQSTGAPPRSEYHNEFIDPGAATEDCGFKFIWTPSREEFNGLEMLTMKPRRTPGSENYRNFYKSLGT